MGGTLAVAQLSSKAQVKTPVKAVEQVKVEKKEPVKHEYKPLTVENLLIEINLERAKYGVEPLILDERLNHSAQIKADDMRNRNYRTHADPEGKHGYEYAFEQAPDACGSYASENIGWNHVGETPNRLDAALASWYVSKPHHDAIVDPKYVYTGFGINVDIVVEHFCQP